MPPRPRASTPGSRRWAPARCPTTSTTPEPRYQRLIERFGTVTGAEQFTCGQHVHVSVGSDDEAVAAVDRLQPWLPTIRALSVNSPYWQDNDTEYASYRSVLWQRWPTAGPTQPFGTMAAYRDTVARLIRGGVALDEAAIYFDARVSARYPTVEIRVADVSTDVGRRCSSRRCAGPWSSRSCVDWRAGEPAAAIRAEYLHAAGWTAARSGLSERLLALPDAEPVAAMEAVHRLVEFVAAGAGPIRRRGTRRCRRGATA